MAGIYWKKVLHRLTFYPVALQSVCDFIAVGIFGIAPWIESMLQIPIIAYDYNDFTVHESLVDVLRVGINHEARKFWENDDFLERNFFQFPFSCGEQ